MTKFVGTVDISNSAGGSEGGEIQLSVAPSNSTLSGPVKIDIYENKIRFFEGSGSARGAYIDLSATASSAGTNILGTSGAMNYAQTAGTKQSNISAAGTTIVSVSITTNGYPVQVMVTGDVENNSAGGWTTLQLYRGSTAIGNIVHTEGSAGSENSPYALTVIDAPAAGTYTYALKLNSCAGGTFNFGESNGPVITAIELAGKTGATGETGPAGASGATTLDGLTDVTAPTPSSGDFLKWNGTAWVNDVIDLSTDTTGNYVASLVAGTGITITNNTGEGATPTISVGSAVTTTSITANTITTVDSFALAAYRSAEYLVQVVQGTKYTVSKVLLIHNDTTPTMTEYGVVELGASRIPLTISTTISGSNVLLQVTITDAASTNATVKLIPTYIGV